MAAALAALASPAHAGKDDLFLVSRVSGPAGTAGAAHSLLPSISADGRFVTFASDADNLSGEDNNEYRNIFVRDLLANTTILVSRAAGPAGRRPTATHGGPVSISADGRFVAFSSFANNLSAKDNNEFANVYVRAPQTNTTTLVSRAAGAAGAAADSDSAAPSLSANGRFAAFYSLADNLSGADRNGTADVFVRDLLGPPAFCAGQRATIVGTPGRDRIRGTAGRDVIAALGGADVIRGLGGNDRSAPAPETTPSSAGRARTSSSPAAATTGSSAAPVGTPCVARRAAAAELFASYSPVSTHSGGLLWISMDFSGRTRG